MESARMLESISSERCPTCKSKLVDARNLTVFIDGTSNKPGDEETNVMKMFRVVPEGEDSKIRQKKIYLKGIGAYDFDKLSLLGHLGREIYSYLEMSLAWNVGENVIQAYKWLAGKHQDGDQIYLFGFSRGAYQVRALATMIHEVGLVKETEIKRSEEAYRNYRSIKSNDPETRKTAIEFKKNFCKQGVRIHFVGVWDTVSSLGLIKQDVHITASASVTNACHFRHALALDERRVKFIPEYFSEVNAHHTKIRSPRLAHSDVQEVWFAGCHSDIGGTSRPQTSVVPDIAVDEHNPVHAGNVPLSWMRREASAQGLVFRTEGFTWRPEDVDFGTGESMNLGWKFLEGLPIRHQVSFSGTGKHARRWHLSYPRSIIPRQRVHSSILSSDLYSPRATLRDGIGIPTSPQIISGGLWAIDSPDKVIPSNLLCDPQTVLQSLEKVSFLLASCNEQIRTKTDRQIEEFISKQFDFARLALAVVYDVASNYSISDELVRKARNSLCAILSSPNQPYFPGTLVILRFATRNETLRRRFVAHDEVIAAFFGPLEQTRESQKQNLFPLVMDALCYLIHDDDQRGNVINQLNARSALSKAGKTRLSLILEVKTSTQLMASLKMITSLARYQPILCRELRPRIIDLAKKGRGLVGSMAVEALVALSGPLPRDVHFSNILGYLGHALPRLHADGGSTSLSDTAIALPPIFQADNSGRLDKGDSVMYQLLRTIESQDADQRTAATLTLLKMCRYPIIREFCSKNNTWDILMRQLQKRETSLLAAYALKTCLAYDMLTPDNFSFDRAAELIVVMINKGWFDDAIGQVEGSEIFRGLMASDNLRHEAMEADVVTTLIRKLEVGERHDVRMSLICLDILDGENQVTLELTKFVAKSLAYLQDKMKKTQIKGVRVLSALAQTKVGEEAIKQHVIDIVATLLPHAGQSHLSRSQLFGPTAVLHNLCRNETLRDVIKESDQYRRFKHQRRTSTLYPRSDEGWGEDSEDPQCPTEATTSHAVVS